MDKQEYDVFISYSRRDYIDEKTKQVIPGNVVSKVKERLTAEGISYWIDEEGIYSGQNFIEKIVTNIQLSKIFLFLSTANSNQSEWTCSEVNYAKDNGKQIIPVRIDSTPYNPVVEIRINTLDFIDYYKNPEEGMHKMVESIKKHLKQIADEKAKKKAEEEQKRKEEELKKDEAERRKKEEIKEIERQCTGLNNDEKRLLLAREDLLLDAERIGDKAVETRLKTLIESSSPLKKKYQEELLKQLADKEKAVKSMETEILSLKQKISFSESKISQLEDEKAKREGDVDSLVKMLEVRDYRIQELSATKKEINELKERLKNEEAEMTTKNNEIQKLKQQLTEEKTSNASKNDEIRNLRQKQSDYSLSISEKIYEIQKLKNQLSDYISSIASKNSEIQKLKQLLTEEKTSNASKNAEIQKIKKELSETYSKKDRFGMIILKQRFIIVFHWIIIIVLTVWLIISLIGKKKNEEIIDEYVTSSEAQLELGIKYYREDSDPSKAVKWFRKAAEQGNAEAQDCLGSSYSSGDGVQNDNIEAVKWFRKSAKQGFANGQYDLGYMYEIGRGVEKDCEKALYWYGLAAKQGHIGAQEAKEQLEKTCTQNAKHNSGTSEQ